MSARLDELAKLSDGLDATAAALSKAINEAINTLGSCAVALKLQAAKLSAEVSVAKALAAAEPQTDLDALADIVMLKLAIGEGISKDWILTEGVRQANLKPQSEAA